jgi:hypothetical protein
MHRRLGARLRDRSPDLADRQLARSDEMDESAQTLRRLLASLSPEVAVVP